MNLKSYLNVVYELLLRRTTLAIALFIAISMMLFYEQVMRLAVIIILIIIAGFSKIYHRFIKSSIGIDLVLYFTIMISLLYSPIIGFVSGCISLVMADIIGDRFSYTSVISLIGLLGVVLLASLLSTLPLTLSAMLLVIIYEITAVILYYLLGSPPSRILLYLITHFGFNLFLVMAFTDVLKRFML